MNTIANLLLKDALPDNQAHLLLWDTPHEAELAQIAFYNNAHRVNYRENLLQRLAPDEKFVTLHRHLERELEAIRSIRTAVDRSMILLEGLDCLITYLSVKTDAPITLFWNNLEKMRKLEKPLWILLPSKLSPPNWPSNRLRRITSE